MNPICPASPHMRTSLNYNKRKMTEDQYICNPIEQQNKQKQMQTHVCRGKKKKERKKKTL